MNNVRATVIELLGQLGSSREARQYLKQFSKVDQTRFAVVKVGGAVLRDDIDALASALAFLHQLGLTPIVLHGAGPQLDEAMSQAGLSVEKHDGLRVTTEAVMAVVRPIIYEANTRLIDALEARGVKARGVLHGVFKSHLADPDNLGLVGEVDEVVLEPLSAAIRAGALPVLACLGESPSGQMMNINADIAAQELVWAVAPHKVIFLTETGGLLGPDGGLISAINLRADFERLMQSDWVHSGMALKLKTIATMLERLPSETSVSITSAPKLTRELFTHTGAGTLIRRGELIEWHTALDGQRQAVIERLFEASFQRQLREDWLAERTVLGWLVAESDRAAALICKGVDGVAYLDKIVVTPEAQGEGLGAALWSALRERFDAMYWRSRAHNPINGWYFQQSQMSVRGAQWVVFAIGVDSGVQFERWATDAQARCSGWTAVDGAEHD
jgi:acetylglutamate kinase